MIEKIKDRQNQYILGGGAVLGAGAGYMNASYNAKIFKNSTQAEIEKLETETVNKIADVNKNILEDCRKNPEYALKIDIFEKEGKIFDKDFYLEDILDESEKLAYKLAKKEFKEKLEVQKNGVLDTAKKVSNKLYRNRTIIGLFAGLSAGVAAIFVKDKIKAEENANNKN